MIDSSENMFPASEYPEPDTDNSLLAEVFLTGSGRQNEYPDEPTGELQ